MKVARLTALCGVALLSAVAVRAATIENADCFVCHSDEQLATTDSAGKAVSLYVDVAQFAASIDA